MTDQPKTASDKPLFPTLAEAVHNELDTLTSAPVNSTFFSGEHVGSFAEQHYYRFEIPEHIFLSYLTVMECSIGSSQPVTMKAVVVAVENQYLTLALPHNLGAVIPQISCSWEYRTVLQPVIDALSGMDEQQRVAQRLLTPTEGNNNHAVSFEPSVMAETPEDQVSALKKIFQNRVSFVWGPILSGKTHLLAHIAANYVKAGKSILFVATMNERVDDVLLRSIEIGQRLGVDMAAATCSLGLPAVENFDKLAPVSFERSVNARRAEKRRSFQERVSLLETYWNVRIKQVLHEDSMAKITQLRERISEKKKQLETLNREILPLKENVNRIQNASMMDRLKKGFGKDDMAQFQRKIEEKQSAVKRLQSQLTTLTHESLRIEAQAPVKGEEQQNYNLAMNRIGELGGLEKVREAVDQYISVDEKALLQSKQFVGTTVVHAISDPRLAGRTFDMVMVDDAESIPVPVITALARFSKEKMVACGDPYQLGPESASNSALAQEWLKRDIFLHVAETDRLSSLFDFTEKNPQWCILLSSHFATTPKLSLFIGSVIFDEKINVFASPKAKGRIFFIDTAALHPVAKQYLGRKKILPHNELQTMKVMELVKHALMEPGRSAGEIGIITPFAGPTLYIKRQLRMSGISNVEVGYPQSFRGRRKSAIIFDTVMAGVDHTIRPIDDQKIGEHQIVRLLNTAFSCVKEDLYVLADMGHFQTIYKDRLLTKLLRLLKAQADPLVNFSLAAKNFDELEWDDRVKLIALEGEGLSAPVKEEPVPQKEDAELAIRMKLMAKKEGVKIEGAHEMEKKTYQSVYRILGLLTDINLLAQYSGGDIMFRRSLSTEKAMAKLPFTVCLSEKEFRSALEDWNLIVYEMSGGHKPESALLKNAPETRVRGDINALKAFYSADVEAAVEEGKQKLAVAVSRVFQEGLGKTQPGNPQEWSRAYLSFLSKLDSYLGWISEQLRK